MSMLPLTTSIHDAFAAIAARLNGEAASSFHASRKHAFAQFTAIGIPSTRHEEWKYTNVMPIAGNSWKHATSMWQGPIDPESSNPLRGLEDAIRIEVRNGSILVDNSEQFPEGLTILPLSAAQICDTSADLLNINPFSAATVALAGEGICLDVADNMTIGKPIHIAVIGDADHGDLLSTTRVVVRVGRLSSIDLVESHHSHGSAKVLDLAVCSVHVAESGKASYTKIVDDCDRLTHIGHVTGYVERSATFASHSVNIAAGFVRNDAQIRLAGEGSQGFLFGVSVLNGNQYVDNHTVVDHMVPHCHSEELYKGVYDGASTGVFNGKIYVRPQAQKTTAYQSSHSLLLGSKAQVNAKPQLEIWADDVKCSHGATTGQLNEDAVFYLQARGLEREKAMSLLTNAFAAEVVEKLPHDNLRSIMMQRLAETLGAGGL